MVDTRLREDRNVGAKSTKSQTQQTIKTPTRNKDDDIEIIYICMSILRLGHLGGNWRYATSFH